MSGFRPFDPNSSGGDGGNPPFTAFAVGVIGKGKAVYISSYDDLGGLPRVTLSDSDSAFSHPVVGITAEAGNNSNISIIVIGELTGIDTSAFAIGDELFLEFFGDLTDTVPANYSQSLAVVEKSNVDGIIRVNVSTTNSATVFNPTTGIVIDRVLEAVSLATSQEPAGTGIANAINIEFGVAQFTVSDPVMIDVNGQVTFNDAGLYRVKSIFQFGRTGASGTSEVLFRLLVNGAQLGRSVGVKLGNSDVLNYIDIDNWFNVPAGTVLDTQIMRDDSGSDSGGIFQTLPTDEGAGTWSMVPCTVLRIERWASP